MGDDERAPLDRVREALAHDFRDEGLLRDALTHRSYVNEIPGASPDNERLEFLGDAVLGFVVATLLFERFPRAPEGELTRRRADLVSEQALSEIAREVGVGAALRLGRGEERSGGRDKPRLLASALEACFGAVVVDAGADAAIALGRRLFGARLEAAAPGATDYKSRAQELAQGHKLPTPRYEIVRTTGPDHAREFVVALRLGDAVLAEGCGRSKLEAEQAAARAAIPELEALARAETADPQR